MSLTTVLVALCLFLSSTAGATPADNCTSCHVVSVEGVHAAFPCVACHGPVLSVIVHQTAGTTPTKGCADCHQGYDAVFEKVMSTRAKERSFVEKTYGREDPHFFQKNCQSCHVSDCLDCHGETSHQITLPGKEACLNCHQGYFVGMEYYGKAPREDSVRYQRGENFAGQNVLKMLPDLHAEIGLDCAACHSMKSLIAGKKASKTCVDCHQVDQSVIEHSIAAHLDKLECYACHSAWAAQEYGTFFIRMVDSPASEYFRLKRDADSEYIKSAYLRKQDTPPLGINASGKVSPIRPQFISYFSDIQQGRPVGEENQLLAAEWKAFFPHTVRTGTVMCEGCHNTPRRFLLEAEGERIYQLERDGMTLKSFWNQEGQDMINGSFMTPEQFSAVAAKNSAYVKAYVEKWKNLLDHVEDSSKE